MLESAAALVEEHRALEEAMADPAVAGDPDRLRETNKRYSALEVRSGGCAGGPRAGRGGCLLR